jgi:hypothetical protein
MAILIAAATLAMVSLARGMAQTPTLQATAQALADPSKG